MENLIGMNANQVPTNGMLGTLAFRDTLSYPVSNVTTATTATTLTSTATLLKITPASYGVAVTLPDATTCSVGGPLHIIDNKGAYPVRVLNNAGTLLGFIFAGVVSHISLADNSTAAGVWTVENSELVGASAQLLTTNMRTVEACVSLDNDRDFLLGKGGSNYSYGVVYNKTTNQFGSVTAIRSASVVGSHAAIKSATDQILVVSCISGSTAFEAVVLSISGTTITVNTAATATLSANHIAFAGGCGLIAVGSSFVCSYIVDIPAAQIRALSISGTTVTIGSATVLDGTAGGLIVASGDKVIAVSAATSNFYTKPYTVSGSTLSAGTGTTTAAGSTVNVGECKLAALGTRWFTCYRNATPDVFGVVISLSGTTTTVSTVTVFSTTIVTDAIIVGSDKVLMLNPGTSNNANILTDTAGTASAGTAITLSSETSRACLYVSGTNVVVGETSQRFHLVSCSGSSPVKAQSWQHLYNAVYALYATSNAVLSRTAEMIFGTTFAQGMPQASSTASSSLRFSGAPSLATLYGSQGAGIINYRGKSDSERWVSDAATLITKFECVV